MRLPRPSSLDTRRAVFRPLAAAGFLVLIGGFFALLALSAAGGGASPAQAHGDKTATATSVPTEDPTDTPTEEPTDTPTEEPTETPTEEPVEAATEEPTLTPTEEPTIEVTVVIVATSAVEEPTALPPAAPVELVAVEPQQAAVSAAAPSQVESVTGLPATGSGAYQESSRDSLIWLIVPLLLATLGRLVWRSGVSPARRPASHLKAAFTADAAFALLPGELL